MRHGEEEQNRIGGWSNNHLTTKGIEKETNLIDEIDNHYDLFVSKRLIMVI